MRRRIQTIWMGALCFFLMSISLAMAADKSAQSTGTSGKDMSKERQEAEKTISKATQLIKEMSSATSSEQKIPDAVLTGAQGIVIVPDLVKAGLVAGGRYGRGVLITQHQGQWGYPVMVTLGGASIGAQIGVESTDLIMVFNNPQAVDNLMKDKNFTLGADASVAAGSMGADKEVDTKTDVLSYQRTKGLFAGVALNGGLIDLDEEATQAYYQMEKAAARGYRGKDQKASEAEMARRILSADQMDPSIRPPESARMLQDALKQYTSTVK